MHVAGVIAAAVVAATTAAAAAAAAATTVSFLRWRADGLVTNADSLPSPKWKYMPSSSKHTNMTSCL